MGIPDQWIHHGSRDEQLEEAGIDIATITRRVREVLDGGLPEVVTVPARRETPVG